MRAAVYYRPNKWRLRTSPTHPGAGVGHGEGRLQRRADTVFDAAGVGAAVETQLGCVDARSPMVSAAIYEKPSRCPS